MKHPRHQDGKHVLECLQRALRITDGMSGSTSSQVPLFLDILEAVSQQGFVLTRVDVSFADKLCHFQYVFFYESKSPEVTQNYLKGLVALVQDHLDNMEHGQTRNESEARFRDIVRFIETKGLTTTAATA